ncbi:hypothetical protein HanRHA438_Chr06g0258571 [Helianthus annuus]|nr:hypothetical protein HanRHA438_Chr06g0258571 [Helianthus annuus]
MTFDFHNPYSPFRILLQQLSDQIPQRRRFSGNLRRLTQNPVKRLLPIRSTKRRRSVNHFVQNDAEAPPIHREIVTVALYHLRCHVLFRSDERVCLFATRF